MNESRANIEFRFGGIGRLYGPEGFQRIQEAHVCVIGIGGVGSWVAEALVRSAVGKLTLVDLDDVCESNINRQIHATDGVIGAPKIETMAERCRTINPKCEVRALHTFYTAKTSEEILDTGYDYVVDAIDSVKHKVELIYQCRKRRLPIIVSGGAGGRIDPSQIRVADLTQSYNDKLLQRVRKMLRQNYGFPRETRRRFKVPCVFSPEEVIDPIACETGDEGGSHRLDCSSGYGAATQITGTFGFFAAAHIVKEIAAKARK
ncbi:tRNA threonylcarbamoyladenosine dehydratase [Puniceicoccaceae bacterium K14]|nr:tRNA threonylcarbamoyladenosine dehydratase [Puniceicoccaceae bacterium K14]